MVKTLATMAVTGADKVMVAQVMADDEDDSSDEEEYESSEVDMTTYDNMRYYHFYNPTNLMLAPGVRYYRGGLGQGGGAFFFDQEP